MVLRLLEVKLEVQTPDVLVMSSRMYVVPKVLPPFPLSPFCPILSSLFHLPPSLLFLPHTHFSSLTPTLSSLSRWRTRKAEKMAASGAFWSSSSMHCRRYFSSSTRPLNTSLETPWSGGRGEKAGEGEGGGKGEGGKV